MVRSSTVHGLATRQVKELEDELLEAQEALEQEAPGQQDTQRVALLRDVRGTV